MDHTKVTEIAGMLQRAATRRTVVGYQRFHGMFSMNESIDYRYRVLEEAAKALCDPTLLDYGCLMALANGLPGDDFFLRFKRLRPAEYAAVMGYSSSGRSNKKRRQIAEPERSRIYEHAVLIEGCRAYRPAPGNAARSSTSERGSCVWTQSGQMSHSPSP
ncbi:hypothetical protein AWB74_07603 [Caballeronia arvi]|uniref:Uncharacterized protein n=1 Tax=Caballeronia arvi TaxID=1777135 RepID=A0A158L016_9BURK|nr:hypothetical protein [Caballeronia arvi]SAL86190.1 hypothetical protein AWB74_07603 [Caballeronia arvi]